MVMQAPRFARSFRQLCQVAALAGSGRLEAVIDGLLIVIMLYGDGPWKEALDWAGAIEQLFDLQINEDDMEAAIERARNQEVIKYNTFEQTFQLSQAAKTSAEQRISRAEELEKRVQANWLQQVGVLVPGLSSDSLWRCLQLYMARAFAKHGADVLAVINGNLEVADDDVQASMRSVLLDSINETGLQATTDEAVAAIQKFFEEADSERSRYVSELVDSAFNLLALGSDPSSARLAANAIGKLRIMLDTNVVFGLIGAQESAEAATAKELMRLMKASDLQVDFLYHEKTLKELEFVISNIGGRLKSRHWTPSLSRTMLLYPGRMSSIEIHFHQQNAETPTSPQVFMGKYDNIRLLLDSLGCKIYRDLPPIDTASELELRGSLIAEYTEYIENLPTRTTRGLRSKPRESRTRRLITTSHFGYPRFELGIRKQDHRCAQGLSSLRLIRSFSVSREPIL